MCPSGRVALRYKSGRFVARWMGLPGGVMGNIQTEIGQIGVAFGWNKEDHARRWARKMGFYIPREGEAPTFQYGGKEENDNGFMLLFPPDGSGRVWYVARSFFGPGGVWGKGRTECHVLAHRWGTVREVQNWARDRGIWVYDLDGGPEESWEFGDF